MYAIRSYYEGQRGIPEQQHRIGGHDARKLGLRRSGLGLGRGSARLVVAPVDDVVLLGEAEHATLDDLVAHA